MIEKKLDQLLRVVNQTLKQNAKSVDIKDII